jgi:hypothetical protein
MHESRQSQKGHLGHLIGHYFRVSPQSLIYFLAILLIMLTSDPNFRSMVLGAGAVLGGFVVQILASGYGKRPTEIVGIYRLVRYPMELGNFMVLFGVALCGKQVDIILLVLLGCGIYFAQDLRHRELRDAQDGDPKALRYQKLVAGMMPTLWPVPKSLVSDPLGKDSPFSLKQAFLGQVQRNIRQIDSFLAHILLLCGLYVGYRYRGIFPFNSLFAGLLLAFALIRTIYFVLRGDRRGKPKMGLRDQA